MVTLVAAGGVIIVGGCATVGLCGLAIVSGATLSALAGYIGVRYYRELWKERDSLFDYDRCVDRFPGICSRD